MAPTPLRPVGGVERRSCCTGQSLRQPAPSRVLCASEQLLAGQVRCKRQAGEAFCRRRLCEGVLNVNFTEAQVLALGRSLTLRRPQLAARLQHPDLACAMNCLGAIEGLRGLSSCPPLLLGVPDCSTAMRHGCWAVLPCLHLDDAVTPEASRAWLPPRRFLSKTAGGCSLSAG